MNNFYIQNFYIYIYRNLPTIPLKLSKIKTEDSILSGSFILNIGLWHSFSNSNVKIKPEWEPTVAYVFPLYKIFINILIY